MKAAFAERARWTFHVNEMITLEKEGNLAENGNLTAAPFRAQFDNTSDSHHFVVCLSADSVLIHMLAGRKHQACAAARTFGNSKAAISPSLDETSPRKASVSYPKAPVAAPTSGSS